MSFLLSRSFAFLFPAARAETTQVQWLRGAPEPAGMEGHDLHPIAEVRPSMHGLPSLGYNLLFVTVCESIPPSPLIAFWCVH